ncbi:DUF6363 domain-containing protein [Vibrio sp.]|nr:DUF6363 domain-containing protein [Vibrio sp.]
MHNQDVCKINSGYISDVNSEFDAATLNNYLTGGDRALVIQGGGQRSIFTAGVLDAWMQSDFDPFNHFYGTSAGALNICAYLSRQQGLGKSFLMDLTTQKEFFNLIQYLRGNQGLGLKWIINKIQHEEPYLFDVEKARRNLGENRTAFAVVTNTNTLHDEYLPVLRDDWPLIMRATCAIPRVYDKEVIIDGQSYVDGGIAAAIPAQEAWRRGSRCIFVIRTEMKGIEDEVPDAASEREQQESAWMDEMVHTIKQGWGKTVDDIKGNWNQFLADMIDKARSQTFEESNHQLLNGGRWMFGAKDIYRLSHLIGRPVDAGLTDLLMIHFQTYMLTQTFIESPPDDCFIMQIRPDEPLRVSSLMSKKSDLQHDYEVGLRAGYRVVTEYRNLMSP